MKTIGEDIETYVESVGIYDRYVEDAKPTVYFLGLSGEIGELVEVVDSVNGIDKNESAWQERVLGELGDVFWYWCGLAKGLKLDYAMLWNQVYSETYSRQRFHERHADGSQTELLKIVSSSGRLLEHLKKSIRDDGGKITSERLVKIEQKLAETLEHVFAFCVTMKVDPWTILQKNYDKLFARNEAGTLQGEGDGITQEERS
jgi:NTP pyrophosphatase (non-canonical NTP hydrolase)